MWHQIKKRKVIVKISEIVTLGMCCWNQNISFLLSSSPIQSYLYAVLHSSHTTWGLVIYPVLRKVDSKTTIIFLPNGSQHHLERNFCEYL